MASRSTTPPEPGDEAPAETAAEQPQHAKPRVARYVDATPRTYHWPDGPQTAEYGDVCALPEDVEVDDGRWEPSKAVITRLRDNHADEVAKTSARQTKARNELHARLADEAKGGEQR